MSSDEERVSAFVVQCPGGRAYIATVALHCPIETCAGRPGAYGRWFRARGHLFVLENDSNVVRLVNAAAPPPSAAASARAAKGLGGVAGCSLCSIPFFMTPNQRGQHEAGRQHQRMLVTARSAFSRMGLAPSGSVTSSAPTHGLSLVLVSAGSDVALSELVAPLGGTALASLLLTNSSPQEWRLQGRAVLLQPRCPELHVADAAPSGGVTTLQPSASMRLSVRFSPSCAGTSTVLVSLFACASGAGGALAGCAVQLRCADPAAAAAIAGLQPTAPFAGRQRRRNREHWGEAAEDAPTLGGGAPVWAPPKVPLLDGVDKVIAALPLGPSRLRVLLQCEEFAAREEMKAFDVFGTRVAAGGAGGLLEVAGLAESRPSVSRGDTVVLRRPNGGLKYNSRVVDVMLTTLSLALGPKGRHALSAGGLWDVRFELRRSPFLIQHAAVEGKGDDNAVVAAVTAPVDMPGCAREADAVRIAVLPVPLRNRALNAQQRLAVAGALHTVETEGPQPAFIVFGPPGTGKTTTLTEIIMQVVDGPRPRVMLPSSPRGGSDGTLATAMGSLSLVGTQQPQTSKPLPPPDTLVLVAAPSNSAVDVLALRLLHAGLPAKALLRVNAYQRETKTIPRELLPCSNALFRRDKTGESGFELPLRKDLGSVFVVAATCCTAQRMVRTLQACGEKPLFSHIVIDEAGQATEPEVLCAIAGAMRSPAPGVGRVVLAGDPRQLGPILRSPIAIAHGLGVSLLERLMDGALHRASGDAAGPQSYNPAFVCMLTDNYRSHPALIAVPNALFYNDALKAAADPKDATSLALWPGLTDVARTTPGGFPLLFHGVQGRNLQEGNSPSWFNPEEAVEVLAHIKSVLAHFTGRLTAADIGVVTPYTKQCVKIRQLLSRSPELRDVMVGSVELFQGGERRVIVVSTVRTSRELLAFDSKHALGFLDNPRRFNVAVSRARNLLVVVGEPNILALDNSWSAMLRYAVAHGAYRGAPLPPGFEGSDSGSGGSLSGGAGGLLERLRADAAEAEAWDDGGAAARGEEMPPFFAAAE